MTKKIREDIKGSVGMPISVQVIGYPWDDEIALGVMKAIETKVNFKGL